MAHIHLIGIGGTGLSAIAKVLLERGETVTGSDRNGGPLAEAVRAAGATVMIGHAAENITNPDVVLRSSAVPDDNPEVQAALAKGIPVVKRIDYMGMLLADQRVIGIAGSHGKTTTTAMVSYVLTQLGVDPGFIVGGEVSDLSTNARAGGGDLFVIEADEYDYMFWGLSPQIAVITNIEHDHPDCFPTEEDFVKAFYGYVERIKDDGTLVACNDDAATIMTAAHARELGKAVVQYSGHSPRAAFYAEDLVAQPGAGYRFTLMKAGKELVEVSLAVPGKHNVQNAVAALAVVDLLGLDLQVAAKALVAFSGAGRRFDALGEARGVLVIDDYGHHPTEIKATLQAARARYPERRIWAIWQPHTYTRTWQKRADFAVAFGDADRVCVTPVYAAREQEPPEFELGTVIGMIDEPMAAAMRDLESTTRYLSKAVRPGDVVIVFSAGDAQVVSAGLLNELRSTEVIISDE